METPRTYAYMYVCMYVCNATGMQLLQHISCGRGIASTHVQYKGVSLQWGGSNQEALPTCTNKPEEVYTASYTGERAPEECRHRALSDLQDLFRLRLGEFGLMQYVLQLKALREEIKDQN